MSNLICLFYVSTVNHEVGIDPLIEVIKTS